MDSDDLRVHLAMLLRLEHIGVVVGAGASCTLGGKTVQQLWTEVVAEGLAEELTREGYSPSAPALERVIDDLRIAQLDATRRNRGDPSTDMLLRLQRIVVRAATLDRGLWTGDEAANSKLNAHRTLLMKLTGARQPGQLGPWIFTPNYDLGIEWAADTAGLHVATGFHGLHRRTFSAHVFDLAHRNALARGEARFGTYDVYLAKIHGSLSWRRAGEEVHEEPARSVLTTIDSFVSGGAMTEDLLVYPGAMKYELTTGYVLGELFRRFTEFVSRPQTALFTTGYSFCDPHINRVIANGLNNPTFQLVIYLPELAVGDLGVNADRAYPWVQRLAALKLPNVTFVGGGSRAYFAQFVADLPDPVIYDDESAKIRARVRELREFGASGERRGDGSAR